jgi:hypothetical protein
MPRIAMVIASQARENVGILAGYFAGCDRP